MGRGKLPDIGYFRLGPLPERVTVVVYAMRCGWRVDRLVLYDCSGKIPGSR